jgi:hypothetical protein
MDNQKCSYELYFSTLNINTYNCIVIQAKCLSLFMQWTYNVFNDVKLSLQILVGTNNTTYKWTLIVK